jgi:hypothetical protein
MGALAVTSASCTQIGHANGARLADLDWNTTSDQRPTSAGAKNQLVFHKEKSGRPKKHTIMLAKFTSN